MGQLSAEESAQLNEHLAGCESCRIIAREYEQLALLDLPAFNIDQSGDGQSEAFEASAMSRLFNATVESAQMQRQTHCTLRDATSESESVSASNGLPPISKRPAKMHGPLFTACGWAAAASLLAVVFIKDVQYRHLATSAAKSISQPLSAPFQKGPGSTQVNVRSSGSRDWSREYEALSKELLSEHSRAREMETALASANHEVHNLTAEKASLEIRFEQEKQLLADRTSDLDVLSAKLAKQRDISTDLETQLREVSDRLSVQKSELVRLQEAALQSPVRLPVSGSERFDTEARELFGARDLHIVDVYDVDHSGKPSRTYGRVYYVNRKLLIFYAFDLNSKQSEHKPVAFQAWGFKQPHSTAPENLGLFIMDDAQLDRWVLRVADPKVLASIDTLFVTVEPPGGSTVPKGHPLLLASLSGPPNHP